MKPSPTTIHFLQINRPACLAGLSGLIAVVALAILFAMQDEGVKSTADSDNLARVQLVSLPDARSSGLVPPIFIKRIDTDLSTLPAAKRKQAFILMILPLVARENDRIRGLRQRLDKGSAPASLVLAQAALESGRGTSRFALEGNNCSACGPMRRTPTASRRPAPPASRSCGSISWARACPPICAI